MLTLAAVVSIAASSQTLAAPPPLNPAWKVPEVIAFIGVKPGDKVADIVGGRLTASLAQAVGPAGTVYAVETAEMVKVHPEGLKGMNDLAVQMPNIVVSHDPSSRRCRQASMPSSSSGLPRPVR